MPVVRARWWAAERSPAAFHTPPSAARSAASPFTVAAIRSIAAASATATPACSALSNDASNPPAYRTSASRIITKPIAHRSRS